MITQRLVLKEYDWAITILFECDCNDLQDVINHLDSIDCPYELQDDVKRKLLLCNSNTGFSYTNGLLRRTAIVINKTDSTKELINTITHECYHFICLLSRATYTKDEEELATLTGRFNMCCWEVIRDISNKNIG